MADYLVTFVGHINERMRPENFPREVRDLVLVQADSQEALVNEVNKASFQYIRLQGMGVRRNPYDPEVANQLDLDRMWVPMHMLTHIVPHVRLLTGEVPQVDPKTGMISLPSGSELVKQ